jgi:hypothetical protein
MTAQEACDAVPQLHERGTTECAVAAGLRVPGKLVVATDSPSMYVSMYTRRLTVRIDAW